MYLHFTFQISVSFTNMMASPCNTVVSPRGNIDIYIPPSSFLGLLSALRAMKVAKLYHSRTCPEGTCWAGGSDGCGLLGYYLPFLLTVSLGTHWHGLACNRVAILFLQHQWVPSSHSGRNSAIALYTCFWTVAPSSFTFRDFCIAIYMYNALLITV